MLAGAARQIHYYYKHIPATRLIAISSLLLQRFFSGRDLVENPYYRYLEEILKNDLAIKRTQQRIKSIYYLVLFSIRLL